MKKVNILFSLIVFFFFLSSEKSEKEDELFRDIGDQLEIQFLKHGELYIKNKNFLLKKIEIELANKEIEKKTELMYRSFMKEDRGMLFILDKKEKIQKMNMKNMRIPLDIVYIDHFNIVIFVNKYVSPMRNIEVINNPSVKYILEINAGMSEKWGIKKGITKVFFKTYTYKKI
ncbi:hypothetical protein BLBBOR_022 [Blattabacterium sp. (Blatta orientalis) str. Tarazona]|uniref:DUF192 domain-containing protein n=1 Tax=Blattabacterium sp. (Blatta orientalis) TaxID=367806 RepID=UPI0002AD7D41|nr:DUF192 domain-containing protein [Blattabacterium sp. (Blatta orientalis)]AGD97937.1 hypothetical protein BLBBOR_022 [Blattabacterium sp. (Blatta orientalis) str. Tarazona]